MIRLILLAAALTASAATKDAPEAASPAAAEKGRLEVYLRERTERIKELHKAAIKFMEEEKETWNAFWNKVKDDRTRFEVHVARQRLNLFESLSSLDPRDHPAAIADFEKLQSKLIQSFEQTQRQKAADFFLTREDRMRAFATQQERERSELQANADTAWRAQKTKLGGDGEVERDPEPRRDAKLDRELAREDREREKARAKEERERERERAREEKQRAKEERERERELARREKERQREERRRAREAEEQEAPSRSRRRESRADEAVTFGPP